MHVRRSTVPASPVQAVARRLRQIRDQRGLSAEKLAAKLRDAGVEGLGREMISNIETGRRQKIDVSTLYALAWALDVAPVHLMVPIDDEYPLELVPGVVEPPHRVREWIRGWHPVPGTDARRYFTEVPAREFRAVTQALMAAEEAVPDSSDIKGNSDMQGDVEDELDIRVPPYARIAGERSG